jgi:hypothetical protein
MSTTVNDAVTCNGDRTATFLTVVDSAVKTDILASIATKFGITPDEAFEEVTDAEAEHLLDYLREPVRGATSVIMKRYGL